LWKAIKSFPFGTSSKAKSSFLATPAASKAAPASCHCHYYRQATTKRDENKSLEKLEGFTRDAARHAGQDAARPCGE
jgi:hypothetical protein